MSTKAQETVQWASEVMFVTSETTALQFSASQALHSPNVYPKGGESPNAWRPSHTNHNEYIVVKFAKPIRAQQIAIAETENPGAVSKVFAYDSLDNEYLLFDLHARPIPLSSRLLNLFFEKTPYRIAYVRVDLACGSVPGYNSIDAIGLSNSNIPISVLIELAPNVNQNLETERLSENVNSEYIEQSPLLSPDGKTLFFSRRGHPDNVGGVDDFEDIWYSELDEVTGEWLPAKNIGAPLNTWGANFVCTVTEINGETVVLLGNEYGKRGTMTEGVSMSTLKPNGKWTKPTALKIENAYNYSEHADFYLSNDGAIMILSQERDDSHGDRDLYVSFENKEKEIWSEPLNLGSVVNSADTEYAPFLDKDNKTLYFSSRGFKGYGGADIYVSKRLDDTWKNWSAPENMGRGVNGKSDDTYFNIPTTGDHAYFTRGATDENTDVFRFRVDELFLEPGQEPVEPVEDHLALAEEPATSQPVAPESAKEVPILIEELFVTLEGYVYDEKTNKPIASEILVERLPDGIEIGRVSTDISGYYKFKVRPGARYGFSASKDGYLAKSENIDLNEVSEATAYTRPLYLKPIEKGAAIVVNNIFFDFNSDVLKTASYSELGRVLKLLKENRIKKLEISGHSDAVGNDAYNKDLSQRRAQSVYYYFVYQGIDRDRLSAIGFGEEKPIAPNDTDENRSKNRRVEFQVIE